MIDDPNDPDYRYPEPGERLWHWRHETWCTVVEDALNYDPKVLGEVPVRLDNRPDRKYVAKLYNLDVLNDQGPT